MFIPVYSESPTSNQRKFCLFVVCGVIFVAAPALVFLTAYSHTVSSPVVHQTERIPDPSFSTELATKVFTCSATCYCNEEEENAMLRRSGSAISKSFYFSISAVTLTVAFIYANKHFVKECTVRYASLCGEGRVNHKVEFCEGEGVGGGAISEEDEEKVGGESTRKQYENYEEEYECEGYCVKNGYLKRKETIDAAEEFGCEKLRISRIVRVRFPKTEGKYFKKWDKGLKKMISTYDEGWLNLSHLARFKFHSEHLKNFCKSASIHKYSHLYQRSDRDKGDLTKVRRKVSLCAGSHTINRFKNVRCSKIREIQ